MWDLPGPGPEPVTPALAGGLPTSEPPGKPPGAFSNGLMHTVFGFINFYIKKNKASKVVVLFLDFIFLLKTKQNRGKKKLPDRCLDSLLENNCSN